MLIAYDERAGRALEYAAQLLRPTTVEILTAWEPVARQTARAVSRTGMHQSTVSPDGVEEDPAYEEALKICRQGIELAESLGLAGRAHLVESATTISSAIIDAAHELDVDVIVTGTRALTGFRACGPTPPPTRLCATPASPSSSCRRKTRMTRTMMRQNTSK